MALRVTKAERQSEAIYWLVVGYEPLSVSCVDYRWRVGLYDSKDPVAGFRLATNPLAAEILPIADPDSGKIWAWLIRHRLALQYFISRREALGALERAMSIEPMPKKPISSDPE